MLMYVYTYENTHFGICNKEDLEVYLGGDLWEAEYRKDNIYFLYFYTIWHFCNQTILLCGKKKFFFKNKANWPLDLLTGSFPQQFLKVACRVRNHRNGEAPRCKQCLKWAD